MVPGVYLPCRRRGSPGLQRDLLRWTDIARIIWSSSGNSVSPDKLHSELHTYPLALIIIKDGGLRIHPLRLFNFLSVFSEYIFTAYSVATNCYSRRVVN